MFLVCFCVADFCFDLSLSSPHQRVHRGAHSTGKIESEIHTAERFEGGVYKGGAGRRRIFSSSSPPLSSSVCVFFTLKIVYFFYLFVSLKRGAARQPPLPTPPKAAHSFLRSCFFSSGEWIRYFKEPRDKGGQRARTRNTKNFFFQGEKRDPRRSMRKGDQFASLFKTRANESVEKRFAALSYI